MSISFNLPNLLSSYRDILVHTGNVIIVLYITTLFALLLTHLRSAYVESILLSYIPILCHHGHGPNNVYKEILSWSTLCSSIQKKIFSFRQRSILFKNLVVNNTPNIVIYFGMYSAEHEICGYAANLQEIMSKQTFI